MSRRTGWDWAALQLFRGWKRQPTPDNMRLGQCLRHLPSDRWMTFGAFEGERIIALYRDVPEVVEARDCVRGWDPEVDPEEFARALCNRSRT